MNKKYLTHCSPFKNWGVFQKADFVITLTFKKLGSKNRGNLLGMQVTIVTIATDSLKITCLCKHSWTMTFVVKLC